MGAVSLRDGRGRKVKLATPMLSFPLLISCYAAFPFSSPGGINGSPCQKVRSGVCPAFVTERCWILLPFKHDRNLGISIHILAPRGIFVLIVSSYKTLQPIHNGRLPRRTPDATYSTA